MCRGRLSIFIFILVVVDVQLLLLLSEAAADGNEFSECSEREYYCGGQLYDLYYPFRIPSSPEYCGHPGFEVTCNEANTTLQIKFNQKNFLVNSIDTYKGIMQVMDPSFYNVSCPWDFANYTFDSSLVNYSNQDVNLTVFANCSTPTMKKYANYLRNITCLAISGEEEAGGGYNSFYSLPSDEWVPPLEVWDKCHSVATFPIYKEMEPVLLNYDSVSFPLVLKAGFSLTWEVAKWCLECTASGGVCGFRKGATNAETCFCSHATSVVGKYCTVPTNHTNVKKKAALVAAIVGGTVALITACCIVICCIYRKKSLNDDQNVENFLKKHGSLAPKRYTYSDVKKITKSFHNKLGQGGYGSVFKGTLIDGHLVAVKVLSDSKGNGEDFFNEIASIGRSSHVNIVNLLGFCSERSKRALIYEYMCNGSLDKLICSEEPKTRLRWEQLYQIATGIARGLEYLHRGCNTRIVHFDIKPHNILLDEDFRPKISDFGLSMLCLRKDSILSMEGTRGTVGYIALEVFSRNFGVVSTKSDIYSYGMMVLEMTGGRENIPLDVQNTSENYFPYSIYKHLNHSGGLEANGATTESEEVVRKIILVGLRCIQTMPQNRPSITKVIECWKEVSMTCRFHQNLTCRFLPLDQSRIFHPFMILVPSYGFSSAVH